MFFFRIILCASFLVISVLAPAFFPYYWLPVVVITTAQLHSTKPKLRFCAGSNPARGVSEIRDGEDLWQWPRLEIRLNFFRRSTMPQKQFIIIIIRVNKNETFAQDEFICHNESGLFTLSDSFCSVRESCTGRSWGVVNVTTGISHTSLEYASKC